MTTWTELGSTALKFGRIEAPRNHAEAAVTGLSMARPPRHGVKTWPNATDPKDIMAALWSVADDSTAELMTRFYA
ncbi:hypothetical protein IV102_31670 [bacterium]|nr:hypothetical protein [bacterium]